MADLTLADAIVALHLRALLPESRRKAVSRLKAGKADRDRLLADALDLLLPEVDLKALLADDDLDVAGDRTYLFMSVDETLRLLDDLLVHAGLADDAVGVALVWRLAFFEFAVRIAAGTFALAPTAPPSVHADLWFAKNGFSTYLRRRSAELGAEWRGFVEVLTHHAGRDAEKNLVQRWLYNGTIPSTQNLVHVEKTLAQFASQLHVDRGRKRSPNAREPYDLPTLPIDPMQQPTTPKLVRERLRLRLFIAAREVFLQVAKLLGRDRADTLVASFSKQVGAAFRALDEVSKRVPEDFRHTSGDGAQEWHRAVRRDALTVAVFGARSTPGSRLLRQCGNPDLWFLALPMLVFAPIEPRWAGFADAVSPGWSDRQRVLVELVRNVTLDDVVADASVQSPEAHPLGWSGLPLRCPPDADD